MCGHVELSLSFVFVDNGLLPHNLSFLISFTYVVFEYCNKNDPALVCGFVNIHMSFQSAVVADFLIYMHMHHPWESY